MPDGPRDTPTRTTPKEIQCHQHGGWHRVEREVILTHEDGSKHRYCVAVCHIYGRQQHEIADYLRRAD